MVDESNLRVGAERTVLRSAQSLFERLAPGDLVGLARLPNGTGGVEFTTDRKRITDALMKVTGAPSSASGMAHVNISEAWALESNDESTFQNAVSRECSGMTGSGPRGVSQLARGRRARDAARGQRARPRDAAVARGAAQEPGASSRRRSTSC